MITPFKSVPNTVRNQIDYDLLKRPRETVHQNFRSDIDFDFPRRPLELGPQRRDGIADDYGKLEVAPLLRRLIDCSLLETAHEADRPFNISGHQLRCFSTLAQ